MKQLLVVAGLLCLLSSTGGCAKALSRGGCSSNSCGQQCNSCNNCNTKQCNCGQCGNGARGLSSCCRGGVSTGCRPGNLSWQQGGTDYGHNLTYSDVKHGQMQQNPGPPSASTAYPYYTTRGPRDFLNANPPSIGY
ncbi:hypothetical protein Poly24_40390 [Rosistilla carotiformis]|uniref:TNFR-Cys domain-containing protein n=1 Tax=Rosistilla carotiformis TaxID=2528017 RepID=A0A518JXQ2_9BACT|nr:hypothetical protein [Rosistilla carotiformis]QDV70318.1 hypothetical protein Poly24_40390 [Rosistilla carotiformis]